MAFSQSGHFGILISAKDQASATMGKIGANATAMGNKSAAAQLKMKQGFKAIAQGATLAVAGGIGLAGAFAAASAAGRFEQGLARVGAISRASAEDLELLEKAAIRAGIETQFSPEEAVAGLTSLAAVGFNAAESISVLNPALDLAAGGMISVEQASSTVSSALKVFQLDVGDAADVTGKLLRITSLTALQAPDLGLALGTVARGAVATNQSLSEMLIVMGLIKNTGVDASVAASSASSALTFMAKNAKKFNEIGVQITDPSGKFRQFAEIALDTDAALSKYSDEAERAAMVTKLFGRFGATAFGGFVTQIKGGITGAGGQLVKGAEAMAFLRGEMDDTSTVAAEFRKILLDTFEGVKTLLRGSVATFITQFGQPFATVLKPVIEEITFLLNGAIHVLGLIPGPIKVILAGIFIAVALFTMLTGVLLLVKGIILLGVIPALLLQAKVALIAASAFIAAYWPVFLIGLLVLGVIVAIFRALGKKPPDPFSAITAPSAVEESGEVAVKVQARRLAGSAPEDVFDGSTPGAAQGRGQARLGARQLAGVGGGGGKFQNTTVLQLDGREVARSVEEHNLDERRAGRGKTDSTGRKRNG